jgi:PAS domain S-box-containing protein
MNHAPPPPSSPGSSAFDENTVFRTLFAALPDALLLVDAAGLIMLANPAATALLGYSTSELTGLNVDALVPDSIRPRHASYREAYGRAPRPRPMGTQMELVAKCRDGSEVMVEIALSPLQSHGLPYVVAAIRGIGTYPRVKQALQRARYSECLAGLGREAVDSRDLQQLLDRVPVIATDALQVEHAAVYLLDPDRTRFTMISCTGVSGVQAGTAVPNRPDNEAGFVVASQKILVVPDLAQEARFQSDPLSAPGHASGVTVPLSDRGRIIGVISVRSTQAQRFGDDEVRFLESLSNLLATCLQRSRYEEALNHAQRLESVGQLTGGIAHDFNNLLTVIQGNLQVLEELPALAEDDRAQQMVGAATRAARRGADLTSKLLAFSRRQVLQPVAVDVDSMLHSLADMLRRTLDKRLAIDIDSAPCPPCVADPAQLESALLNIAINARDAMPDGGTLRFKAWPCQSLPIDVHGNADEAPARQASDGYVAISLADSGTGMSDEVKERAFEPFFTTKEAGRGTGLGLSTVYGFVTQSRGAISLDSEPGAGTTVTLYIPCVAQTEAAPSAVAHRQGEEVPPGLRVLLVEDDPEVRAVMQLFLETLHCEVLGCDNGEAALACVHAAATGFDLLLTDIALGAGMRGTQLASLAQQALPQLKVVLMSGFSAELLDADREAPADWELLPKPCSRQELARAISLALGDAAAPRGQSAPGH